MLQEVDAVTVVPDAGFAEKLVSAFSPPRDGHCPGGGVSGFTVVEVGLRMGGEGLVQAGVADHDGAPAELRERIEAPIPDDRSSVDDPPLAVSHLLEDPVPVAAHPAA